MGCIRQRVDNIKESPFAVALDDLETSKQPSIRAAAARYGLKYETLRDRKRGAQNPIASHEEQQHLTIEEETAIEEWISKVDSLGWPPRIEYVQEMALGFMQSHRIREPTL